MNDVQWLSVCKANNAFCYVYLIAKTSDTAWVVLGVNNSKNICAKLKQYKSNERCINSSIEFSVLGKVDMFQKCPRGFPNF